jgi:hypothetical protein
MSGLELELEERLRQLAPAFKDGIEPPARLHGAVMSATTAAPARVRRPSMLRELSLAAALIAFVALLAFGFSRLHLLTPEPVRPNPTPKATTTNVIPWTAAPMVLPSASAQLASPADAATWIGHTVTAVDPLLVPTAIGDDYTAQFVADQHSFVVDYSSSVRHATVELATLPVMPNQGATANPTIRTFRGVAATYQVDSATPTAPRSLLWTENSANHGQAYSLIAAGLNETEFWQVANSLHALQGAAQLRPCLAADLRAAAGKGSAATGGQIYNSIVLSNHSSTSCRLDGTPRLQLITASARSLALAQTDMATPWAPNASAVVMDPGAPAPAPTAGQLNPAGQATVVFIMYDCPGPEPALSRIVVGLPNGRGSLSVPAGTDVSFSRGAACEGNASVHSIGVSPFSGLTPQANWVEASSLSIALKLPDHVRAGQSLHYQVVLTNTSGAPFHFRGECPSYTEDASRPGLKNLANYQLNCSAVEWLGANESVTFAMVLDIPADTPPGTGDLRWEMSSAYGGGVGRVVLTVTAT